MADGQPRIVNPWDEYALEIALQLKEKHGGKKVTALSLGRRVRLRRRSRVRANAGRGLRTAPGSRWPG